MRSGGQSNNQNQSNPNCRHVFYPHAFNLPNHPTLPIAMLPGTGGIIIESGQADFPKVQFYACSTPSLIITKGYHANFEGQYDVAIKVLNFLAENHVKRIIVVAGYGSKDKKICCAASNKELLAEMKEKYGVDIGYKGPFMGFSG